VGAAAVTDDHAASTAHPAPAPTRSRRRVAVDRLLVLAGLCGLAVAQPLLELLGKSPSTFQYRGLAGKQIAWFAVAVVVVPPVALWLVGVGADLVRRRAGTVVHLATVAALLFCVGVLFAKAISDAAGFDLGVGLAAATGGTWAYARVAAVGLWLRLLAAANLVFLFTFCFASPASDWITTPDQVAADTEFSGVGADGQPPSVLMLVLDELPTQSILDADGAIDPVRFPNLARLAGDATWYRHSSTVSPFTQSAVPALLDGQDPHGDPIWTDHPDNLFSLLAGSHHLIVSESLTKLCGFEVCAGEPVPPPDAGDDAAPDAGSAAGARSTEWAALAGDVRRLWVERVGPGPVAQARTFDDFEEDLSRPGQTPGPTTPDGSTSDGSASDSNGEALTTVPANQALDGYFASSLANQPTRLTSFVDALQPTDQPFLAFLHLVLPHQPWFSREDGARYRTPGDYTGPDIATPWRARVTRQRHLLQAQYADRLVGLVLDRLQATGEYDDAVVVVAGDHGASFEPGESIRSIEDRNLDDIAYAPLLIKAPGQEDGAVDDRNVLTVDVVPTVAALLGTEPTWDVDGVALTDDPAAVAIVRARGDDKYVFSYTDAFTYDFLGIEEFGDREQFAAMRADVFDPIGPRDDPIAALYAGQPGTALVGRPADEVFVAGGDDALVRELDALRDPGDDEPLGEVIGVVPGSPAGATVVVAVNGTVVGVSPVFDDATASRQFVVLLPADALRTGDDAANEVRIGVLAPDGTTAAELDLAGTD